MSYIRGVILPDLHDNDTHEKTFRCVCNFIKDFSPNHLIQLGDFSNWDSLGGHALRKPEDFVTFREERKSANHRMDRLESFLPKECVKFMTGGNHEDRHYAAMVDYFNSKNPRIKATQNIGDHWSELYNLKERGWGFCEYGDYYSLGKLRMTHGWFATKSNSDVVQTSGQIPGKSIICAHNHKHHVFNCNDEKGRPIEVESIGTLSKFELGYLKGRRPTDWVHMFMFFYMRKDGKFTKYPVFIIDGTFIFDGKEYSG